MKPTRLPVIGSLHHFILNPLAHRAMADMARRLGGAPLIYLRLGEVPVAFVVGRPVPDDELIALCRQHLVAYKIPVAFRWIEKLPRNEAGKVLRGELVAAI